MGMPAVVGVGASASGQAAVTAAFPVGYTPVAGHVGVIFQECDNSDTPAVPSGWALITGQGVASGTTTKLTAFWIRFAGGETAPSVPDPGLHQIARMIVVSGCKTTGNPWNIFITATELVADTSVSINGVTTTANDCLILAAFATGQDANNTTNATGWANASLANVAERMDNWTAQGPGGGFAMATGEKAAAGATGATTATVGTANNKALMTIALEGAGVTEHQASATLTATGTLAAGATRDAAAAATLAGTGTLAAVGALNRNPPNLNTPAESTWTPAAASKTTTVGGDNGSGSLSWSAGDIIVVLAMSADNATTYGTPTVTGLTFASLVGPSTTASSCKAQAWSATAAGTGSDAITLTSNNQNPYGLIAYRISGSDGLGNTNLVVSTALTASLTTGQDESAVLELTGDWGAAAVTGATPTPALPANWTEREEQQVAGQYSVFAYDWADRDSAATASYGIGGSYSGSGQNYTKLLVEVLATDAAAGGTEHQAAAALAGTGTLAAAAARAAAASAALVGTATLQAAVAAERPAAATLAGTATLTCAGVRTATLGAALAATGTLTAAATRTATAAAALAATGALTAEATVGAAPVLIQAALAGTGTLTAAALREGAAAATLGATATLTATAAAAHTVAAQLAALATLQAGLALATTSAAQLAATATLLATTTVAGAYTPAYWSIDTATTTGTLDTHTSTGTLDTATTASGHLT